MFEPGIRINEFRMDVVLTRRYYLVSIFFRCSCRVLLVRSIKGVIIHACIDNEERASNRRKAADQEANQRRDVYLIRPCVLLYRLICVEDRFREGALPTTRIDALLINRGSRGVQFTNLYYN